MRCTVAASALALSRHHVALWAVAVRGGMRRDYSSSVGGNATRGALLSADPLVASGVRGPDHHTLDDEQAHEPSFQQKRRFFGAAGKSSQRRHTFGQKAGDHHLEKGLAADAKRVAAEAEAEYHRARGSLRHSPGGLTGGEPVLRVDENGEEVVFRRLAAPFGETVVPSNKERFALRGMEGQLSMPRDEKWKLPAFQAVADKSLWLERQMAHLIDAPSLSVEAKADQTARLMADVWTHRLSLQPKTWNGLYALWGQAHAAPLIDGYEQAQRRISRRLTGGGDAPPVGRVSNGNAAASVAAAGGASSSMRFLDLMRQAYIHMRATFTAPTPSVMETMMASLALAGDSGGHAEDKRMMHLANRILLDADKYVVLPTRTTYAAYFDICNRCELMDYAVTRFADAVDRLYIEPDAAMATALLRGLNENGLVEEAVALLGRLEHIHIDVQLLNTSMEVLLLSQDARAALAAYEAVRHTAGIVPSSETFTLMLLACEKLGDWAPVVGILSDMQAHTIRGDPQCLNLLLKGLLAQQLTAYAHQLYLTMKLRRVDVWPSLASVLPKTILEAPSQLSQRRLKALVRERRWLRGNEPLALTRHVVTDARRVAQRAGDAAGGVAWLHPTASDRRRGVATAEEESHAVDGRDGGPRSSRNKHSHQTHSSSRQSRFVDLDALTVNDGLVDGDDSVLPQLPRRLSSSVY